LNPIFDLNDSEVIDYTGLLKFILRIWVIIVMPINYNN